MAKVTNKTDRGIPLRGWRVLPNGSKVVDRSGRIHKSVPDEVAYCPQAKALADQGVLELEGYAVAPPKPTVKKAEKLDLKDTPGKKTSKKKRSEKKAPAVEK